MPRPRGKEKNKQKQRREPTLARTTEVDNLRPFERIVTKHTMFKRNNEQIVRMLTEVLSEISSLSAMEPEEATTRLDMDMELRRQSLVLSTLTGMFSDMRDLMGPPETIKILNMDLQENIMARLPVDSLARFRCVSKTWKSLIDSPRFIAAHSRMNQPKHVLVEYQEREMGDTSYVSFADDDSFPRMRAFPVLPPSLCEATTVGTCYGLICFYCYDSERERFGKAVLWNPCIGKSIAIDVPDDRNNTTVVAFGVCPVTIDPKIVCITHPQSRTIDSKQFGSFWKVSVYKLSSRKFRKLSRNSSNLPSVSIRILTSLTQVALDRLLYWCAQVDLEDATSHNLLMSFDITHETFDQVNLPRKLASLEPCCLSISKLMDSLVVLAHDQKRHSYGVWKMMDHGSLTKISTINSPPGSLMLGLPGFRNTGAPLMSVLASSTFVRSIQLVYQPDSNKHSNLLLSSYADTYYVLSYTETLLLIGCSGSVSTSF